MGTPASYKKWVKENKERYNQYHKEDMRKRSSELKKKVLTYYGNGKLACVRCGFSDIRALSIDHLHGNGAEHRRKIGNKFGTKFYSWLKVQGFPEGYQTLCMNCQFIGLIEEPFHKDRKESYYEN